MDTKATVETWLEDYEQKLRGYARSLASRFPSPITGADDIYQAMCERIWKLSTIDPDFLEKGHGYLLKVCWNAGLMMLRSERRYSQRIENPFFDDAGEEPESFEIPDASPSPEVLTITGQDVELIAQAIQCLPKKARTICNLLYAGQRPYEIAQDLGVSRAHISQTTARIRGWFEQAGITATV